MTKGSVKDNPGEDSYAAFNEDRDFGAFDPVRWTPNGTLVAGEEWSGTGRAVEICNPLGDAPAVPVSTSMTNGDCKNDADAEWRVLNGLPLTAWEGISYSPSAKNKVWYIIDEDNTGSVYKVEFVEEGEYNKAQTFALVVDSHKACIDAGECTAAQNWNSGATAGIDRTGPAKWVAITDANGDPIPGIQDPTENILRGEGDSQPERPVDAGFAGRLAADAVGGTPFGRPEDTTISVSANGYEMLYFTATSENSVYSVEETPAGPYVRVFAGPETPKNLGFETTTAGLNSPDNLAIDSLGNVYIIEDSPNTTTIGAAGGDIWFARDTDNDGVAESIDHFLSLQVPGSEHTGMIFNPEDPTKFVVAIQHPQSTLLSDQDNDQSDSLEDSDGVRSSEGAGDAIWEFDVAGANPPACGRDRREFLTYNPATRRWVSACSSQRDYNATEQMDASEGADDFPTP